MALVNRVARLFKADFNAVLDQIEEPEQLLKQAIRDMEDELAATERRIAARAHEQVSLAARKGELQSSIDEIEERLELCFASGKDDLARSVMRKKLEAQRVGKTLAARSSANDRFLTEQRKLFDENRVALEGLRQKVGLLSQRVPATESHSNYADVDWLSRDLQVGDEEVEIAFLREKSLRGDA